MTHKDDLESAFPQDKQIGGSHYKFFPIQPYEFISKNGLTFFQGCVVKTVWTKRALKSKHLDAMDLQSAAMS